ncbi:hypothetical protein DBB30_20170 [Yersinia pestis]|jgi:hypothetical protein|nr:hypothetical protein ABWED_3504 [Acinetobacter lwoffii]PWF34311.1 hypothetical protein DBB30_20170 [Yersinia pestis]UHT66568.1 hypothetical protein ABEDC_3616 [Acinetobacter lwoffii]
MQIIMNKEDHKKMLDQFERSNKQREDSKRFTAQFFLILALIIGFYTGYGLLPPTDFITFIGFVFMSLVSAIGMFMLFAFIFQF